MKDSLFFVTIVAFLAIHFQAGAETCPQPLKFSVPEQLAAISGTAIYSIAQDSQGAIWFNTGFGLYRFNGHEGALKTKALPMHHICSSPSGDDICAISSDALYRFNSSKSEPIIYHSCGRDLTNCALFWFNESPVVGVGNEICTPDADTLITINSGNVKGSYIAGTCTSDGCLLLSTDALEIQKFSPDMTTFTLKRTEAAVSVFFRSSDGTLWAGTKSGRLVVVDEASLEIKFSQDYSGRKTITTSEIRTIAEGADGQIYFGTADGLYCQTTELDGDNVKYVSRAISLNGSTSIPVCSVFRSKNNSLWVGTFYHGVMYSSSESIPFENISDVDGNSARLVKAIAPLDDGRLAMVFTDGNGVYMFNVIDCTTKLMEGLPFLKYQSACDTGNEIIAVDYSSELLVISKRDFACKRIDLHEWDNKSFDDKINCLAYYNDELYAGGNKGLYLLDTRNNVLSRIEADVRILNLKVSCRGTLLASGDGLYEWDGKELVCRNDGSDFMDAVYGHDGTLWVATSGFGLLRINNGDVTKIYNRESDGIGSDFLSAVIDVGEGILALGTRAGITLLDCKSGIVRNYSSSNGLTLGNNLTRIPAILGDKVIFGGTLGPAVMDRHAINAPVDIPLVNFEKLTVNGEELVFDKPLHCLDEITLEAGQNNFNVTIATFDYPEITAGVFSYRLDGLETEWMSLNLNESIVYRNLKPGRYCLHVRSSAGEYVCEKTLRIRVKPEWWQSWWFISLFILFMLLVLASTLKITYSKIILAEKLKNQERENEERINYFVQISRSLRNPLSLIIGQLEIFLRSNAVSTGRNQIESIYKNAEQMQRIISEYENIENMAANAQNAIYVQPPMIKMSEARFHEYRMLIVDENDEIREMLRTIFSSRYDIIEEKDGEKAWHIALREVPDIIISDIKLPHLGGIELCQKLRQNFETRHIVIILLTAHASEQSSLFGIANGVDDYFTKPFNVKMLEARCDNLLKSRRLLMDKYSLSSINRRKETSFTPEAKFLNAAIGVVERNISNPDFSVVRLCSEMCISKTSLTNKLHEAAGMSPRDLIEDLRLKMAAQRLLDGGKSISEIADEFCFCSPKYFSLRFSKKFGVIPSRYAASITDGSVNK